MVTSSSREKAEACTVVSIWGKVQIQVGPEKDTSPQPQLRNGWHLGFLKLN